MRFEHRIQMDEEYPMMQMVPFCMREDNKEISDDYEPKVVSLGPYHHGKEKLRFVEEYFKPMAVEMFVGDSGVGEHDCMSVILEEIGYAKSCYLQEFAGKYSDEEFARMMLRDACVILNYIGPTEGHVLYKQAQMIQRLGVVVYANIERDMYLLENQIPFRILKMLVSLRYNGFDHGQRFVQHVEIFFFRLFFYHTHIEEPNDTNNLGRKPLHLLEIIRRVVVTGLDYERMPRPYRCCDVSDFVSCLEYCCYRSKYDPIMRQSAGGRSVTDLKLKGIHFSASGIKSLKGVRFSPSTDFFLSANLKLPSWDVTTYTRVFFMNMIAYEFSPYFFMRKSVTAYVRFMKDLVVSKEDLKELREKGIIINSLGDDEQVVKLFKALNTYKVEDATIYWVVKNDIEEHINSIPKTTMGELIAELRTNYFNNHWSIIVFVATIFIICLNIVQTYYTIHPNDDKP
ncbi:hypothetical protein P3S67_003574 [Capsicum chacoense]